MFLYHELYPNAFRQVSEGVSGCIYIVDADDNQYIPFKDIPCARLGTETMEVIDDCIEIDDAYDFLQEKIRQGKLKVSKFEDKTPEQLAKWYEMVADYMHEKNMPDNPDCSYAGFVRDKFPGAWEMLLS